MSYERQNSFNEFFDKLHNDDRPRNLRQIFEDDDKPLEHESKNLRYQPDLTLKQKEKQQQKEKEKVLQKDWEKQQHRQARKAHKHSSAERSKEDSPQPTLSWTTIVAKVAVGFNGSLSVGRVGVALSRNEAGGAKLVVYKSRSELLSTLLLTKTSTSSSPRGSDAKVILRESYLQFYDDSQSFWSLRFENESDEKEFLKVLEKNGLPVHESLNDTIITPRSHTPPATTTLSKLTNVIAPFPDSDSESTQSMDELTLPVGTIKTAALRELPKALPAEQVSPSKLETYLQENRAVDKQVSNIVRTICEVDHSYNSKQANADKLERNNARDRNIEIILQAMEHMAVNGVQKTNESHEVVQECSDSEDQLLELEQKLLDTKKKNRALAKELKYKDQALAELRASTSALCEELMAKNTEIKLKNKTILTLATKENNNILDKLDLPAPATDCSSCMQYLTQIAILEERNVAMYNVLLSFTNESGSTAPTGTSSQL